MSSDWNFEPIDWVESKEYGLYGIEWMGEGISIRVSPDEDDVRFFGFDFVGSTGSNSFYTRLKEWCEENFTEDQYELRIRWPDFDRFSLNVYNDEDAMAVKLRWL